MKRQYFALKASLPMLLFGENPPMDSARFLAYCEAFLAPDKLSFLRSLGLAPRKIPELEKNFKDAAIPSGQKWNSDTRAMEMYSRWEICLRNTLARLRAGKLGLDAGPYAVPSAAYESTAAATAQRVFGLNADPLEKERALDQARWDFLDGMEWSHAFNFEALCIYRCKLLILEKWAARRKDRAAANLDAAAARSEQATEKTE